MHVVEETAGVARRKLTDGLSTNFDSCELRILDENDDLDYLKLANDVDQFCCYAKGISGYDVETTEELAEAMKKRGTILLWWD